MTGAGDKAYNVVMAVLMAGALGIGGYVWNQLDEARERSSDLSKQLALIEYQLEQLSQDEGTDAKQDETISKFWVLHSWAKDELTQLRAEHGLGLARWPNVTGGSN